ncbi:MAG: phosphatase PAP2 family protein [Alphaproteobacteria bacterium]|nr:phosphatase PAP2 family protein [Alphaproteobacteria bacterium]
MHRILWATAGAVVAVDVLWARAAHFEFESRGYLLVAEAAALLTLLGLFYGRIRRDERLAAMLSGTGFLIVFSSAFSALNYMLLTVAGPRIDAPLAAIDRAVGFDWPGVMAYMALHPFLDLVLQWCYNSVLPQIALVVLTLGWAGQTASIFRFCLSVAIGAGVTVFLWTLYPSFGAFSVYHLPAAIASHLDLALDGKYANDLVHLLHDGPGLISPRSARGLIGFPSFHGALAMLTTYYGARVRHLKWPLLCLNACVLVATPIQGGHHLVDVLGGIGVAAAAIWASMWVCRRAATRAEAESHIQMPAAAL